MKSKALGKLASLDVIKLMPQKHSNIRVFQRHCFVQPKAQNMQMSFILHTQPNICFDERAQDPPFHEPAK
jgi:hypothetical protein